ncbi:MAG: response regulator [Pseudomonadota bacterium]
MSDRLRILLVEDNPGDADLMVELLSINGPVVFEINCVTRLSEALKSVGTRHRFDIVLLDLGLPDSDGLETLYSLRRQAAELPIVVLTGNNDERTGLAAIRGGSQDYLIKGQINKNLLTRSIYYAVERKQAENALKELNDTLEERIVERTAALSKEVAERKRYGQERDKVIAELQEANRHIETLTGLLPICASCKNIKNSEGDWEPMESYIQKHSSATFSHGLCHECAKKLYPEFYDKCLRQDQT